MKHTANLPTTSFVPRIREFPNMIILRTFSKAFGLAMLRLGYTVANPALTKIFTEKAPLPYPVSGFTIRMGIKMLENMEIMRTAVAALVAERGKLIKALNQIRGRASLRVASGFPADKHAKARRRSLRETAGAGHYAQEMGQTAAVRQLFPCHRGFA